MKSVMVISDLSSYGKCSITVALPILSAMQLEAIPVLTCVLPTHTGGFLDVSKFDMSAFFKDVLKSFVSNKIKADYIYTGYVSNYAQFLEILKFFEVYKNSKIIVDPIMADNGKFYSGMDESSVKGYKSLIRHGVYLITPNVTEARALLNMDMEESRITEEEAVNMLKALLHLGTKAALITSVLLCDGFYYNFFGNGKGQNFSFEKVRCNYKNGHFCGTGDIFGCVVVGSLANGYGLNESVKRASLFVEKVISKTLELKMPENKGLCFELFLNEI